MEISSALDWISATCKSNQENPLPDIVKSSHWIAGDGRFGYKASRKFISGVVEYAMPVREEMGTHIVYSGTALSYLRDTFGQAYVPFDHHMENGHSLSRIDIAVDIMNSGLKVAALFNDYEAGRVKTRVRSKAVAILKSNGEMETMYVGNKKSRKKLLRIYNKAIEAGKDDLDWIRVELECRQQNANRAARHIFDSDDRHGAAIALIRGFCDFTDNDIWVSAMNSEPVELSTKVDKSDNTIDWLMKSCAPALAKSVLKYPEFEQVFYDRVRLEMEKYLQGEIQE